MSKSNLCLHWQQMTGKCKMLNMSFTKLVSQNMEYCDTPFKWQSLTSSAWMWVGLSSSLLTQWRCTASGTRAQKARQPLSFVLWDLGPEDTGSGADIRSLVEGHGWGPRPPEDSRGRVPQQAHPQPSPALKWPAWLIVPTATTGDPEPEHPS